MLKLEKEKVKKELNAASGKQFNLEMKRRVERVRQLILKEKCLYLSNDQINQQLGIRNEFNDAVPLVNKAALNFLQIQHSDINPVLEKKFGKVQKSGKENEKVAKQSAVKVNLPKIKVIGKVKH
jgi:hypothetical protein